MFCMNMRCHCIKAEKLNSFRPFFVLRKYLFPFKNSVIVCKYGKLFSDSKFNENALQKKIVQYNVSYSPTKSPIHSTLHRFLSRLADLVVRSLGPALSLSLPLSLSLCLSLSLFLFLSLSIQRNVYANARKQ